MTKHHQKLIAEVGAAIDTIRKNCAALQSELGKDFPFLIEPRILVEGHYTAKGLTRVLEDGLKRSAAIAKLTPEERVLLHL